MQKCLVTGFQKALPVAQEARIPSTFRLYFYLSRRKIHPRADVESHGHLEGTSQSKYDS